jgi:glutamate-1-semialdehyde 2,1-aminomutase
LTHDTPIPLEGLYAITPEGLALDALRAAVAAALAGGCRWVQYRSKAGSPVARKAEAQALHALCATFRAGLIINDDMLLAQALGVGVHLGRADGDIAAARALLGPHAVIGASCYQDFALAARAVGKGASYVAFGALYASPTKPDAARAPLALLTRARECLPVPVCAIGGITIDNVAPVIAAGADMVAVISDLFSLAPEAIRARVAAYQQCFADVSACSHAPRTRAFSFSDDSPEREIFQPESFAMNQNQILFERAQRLIPGGVNSPVRAFRSVGGTPPFIARGSGARIQDADGKRYLDYVGSWGPLILGHAHPAVIAAVQEAAARGLSFGAPTQAEVELAERLVALVPSLEMVRLVSSGTEATMSAIRLARGYTGRDLLLKFEGCYHGHSDSLLVKAGSGLLTFGNPSSAGIPADVARHTLVLPYNDTEALTETFARQGETIAAVILEPVAGNMNLVAPRLEFLRALRELTQKHGAVLIFDEVMTGFRVGLTSAQGRFGITPDLSTFGKVIGGGMPLAAFGGRREIMAQVAPLGAVYQAGTLSGNPVAVAAGLATLDQIQAPGFFETLEARAQALCAGLTAAAKRHGVAFCAQNVGGMFGLYFAEKPPESYAEVMACDTERFNRFFHAMLAAGHYFAPSAFEAGFVSAAHTQDDIASTIAAADACFCQFQPQADEM